MAITAKTVTINDTALTTEQQNQLQYNALATLVTNNDLMVEGTARNNTTLNTTAFTGNYRSIVNAINLLATNITSATDKANTAVTTCNSVYDGLGLSASEDLATLKTNLSAGDDATIVTLLTKIYDLIKNNSGSSSSSSSSDTTTYLTAADLETALASYAKTTDLSSYAKSSDLSDYAKTSALSGYATTDSLSAYAKTTDLDSYEKTSDLTTVLADYAKASDISDVARTSDLTAYAKTTDLSGYATTASVTETLKSYATTASVEEKIAAIGSTGPTFKIVETLPTTDIDTSAIYLVKNSDSATDNQYTEYYRLNDAWEIFGVVTTSTTIESTTDSDADALFAEQIEAEVTEDTSATEE